MQYTILSTRQDGETVYTDVEYAFDGHDPFTVQIAHFAPKSLADIALGISNRAASELRKIEDSDAAAALILQIEMNTPKIIE